MTGRYHVMRKPHCWSRSVAEGKSPRSTAQRDGRFLSHVQFIVTHIAAIHTGVAASFLLRRSRATSTQKHLSHPVVGAILLIYKMRGGRVAEGVAASFPRSSRTSRCCRSLEGKTSGSFRTSRGWRYHAAVPQPQRGIYPSLRSRESE
jgi:hypothetical protein